jgi:hypothetical protein
MIENYRRDPVANGISVIVLIGMIGGFRLYTVARRIFRLSRLILWRVSLSSL